MAHISLHEAGTIGVRLPWRRPRVAELPADEAVMLIAQEMHEDTNWGGAAREAQAAPATPAHSADILAFPDRGPHDALAQVATVANDPLAGMTPKQIYRDCIWASDEDAYTKIMLLCVERFMKEDLRSSSMSYAQIAADCGFSDETAKRCAKRVRDQWLRIEVGKGYYVPGKGHQNLYHGIIPTIWADELRRRKLQRRAVKPDEAVVRAADNIIERVSGVSHRHGEGIDRGLGRRQRAPSGVSDRHPKKGKAGCLTDTAVSGRRERGVSLTPLLSKDTHQEDEGAHATGFFLDGHDVTLDAAFDMFWLAFPPGRKRDTGGAFDLFTAIATNKHPKRRATVQMMVDGARRYAASKPNPKYTPMPTTWLNGGRWADDLGQPSDSEAFAEQQEFEKQWRRVREERELS